jgi:hypothetical protein
LSYTDKKGKYHSNCHTSKKKAQAQIGAIEMPESNEVDSGETLEESIMITIMLFQFLLFFSTTTSFFTTTTIFFFIPYPYTISFHDIPDN